MEISNQYSQNNDILGKQSKENPVLLHQKIISDEAPTVNNKEEITNALPLLENMIKSNNNNQRSQSEKPRKNSVIKIKGIKEDENNKKNSIINPERKHSIKRNERKNQTINMVRKPRKNNELGGTIKVVGKISSKLESVIHKLEQNFIKENISNTRIENKYVMGPKIKEALEKINKKIEEDKNIQKISFTERKYKEIIVSDSDRDKKTQSVREKTKYIQEINEDKYEEEEGEDDGNESFNIGDNKEKNNSKTKYKNKKKRKKNSIKVLNLSGESSSDIEDENDTKNKENIKKIIK